MKTRYHCINQQWMFKPKSYQRNEKKQHYNFSKPPEGTVASCVHLVSHFPKVQATTPPPTGCNSTLGIPNELKKSYESPNQRPKKKHINQTIECS
jgi:hypothetical protein